MRHMKHLLLALVFVAGCSMVNGQPTFDMCSAVSVTATTQQAVELAATTMIGLQASIPPTFLQKASATYSTWAFSQGTLRDALVALNDAGGKPSQISVQQYGQILAEVALNAAAFLALYNSMVNTPAIHIRQEVRATAAACVPPTDTEIQQLLTPPTWSQLGGK